MRRRQRLYFPTRTVLGVDCGRGIEIAPSSVNRRDGRHSHARRRGINLRPYALTLAAASIWFGLIVVLWAIRPLPQTVAVGIDYSNDGKTKYVRISCNAPVNNAARDSGQPLPPLPRQPPGAVPLRYPSALCEAVHQDARRLLVINTSLYIAVIFALASVAIVRPRLGFRRV